MTLAPSNRSNPCPICENISGKCRQSQEDIHYWQCMTFPSTSKGEILKGFKCLGSTSNGGWVQFRLDNTAEWTAEQQEEFRRENERRKRERLKIEEEKKAAHLSAVERDRQYQKLLSQLSLHPDDRADLIRRGFTNQQIDLCGFKSVEQWQRLQSEFSHLLPGKLLRS